MAYIELGPAARDLLYSTVRIETISAGGRGTGTGFLFSCEWEGNEIPFVVTNKHVIQGAQVGRFFLTESDGANAIVGQRIDLELSDFEARWHLHPSPDVDIAIMPFSEINGELNKSGKAAHLRWISEAHVPGTDLLNQIGPFSDVLFIGYPNGHFDRVNLMPIIRQGITATPPHLDYNGAPIVLIDASVFPGSSGSPVFIVHSGPMFVQGNRISFAPRLYLLGIIAEVMVREEHGQLEFVSIPTAIIPIPRVNQMIDLGVVYRSSEVTHAALDYLRAR